jgi:hypothetical protein
MVMTHFRTKDCFLVNLFSITACISLLAGCSLVTSSPGTSQVSTPTPIIVSSTESSTPITATLTLSLAPRLGQKADLTFTFKSILDTPGTQAEIILPDGAVLDSGSLKWSGDLNAGEPVTLKATIHFVKEGNFTLEGKALSPQANGDIWGDGADIYINVAKTTGSVGFSPDTTPAHGVPVQGVSPSP